MIKGAKLNKEATAVEYGQIDSDSFRTMKPKWSLLQTITRKYEIEDGVKTLVGGNGAFQCRQTGEVRNLDYRIGVAQPEIMRI